MYEILCLFVCIKSSLVGECVSCNGQRLPEQESQTLGVNVLTLTQKSQIFLIRRDENKSIS